MPGLPEQFLDDDIERALRLTPTPTHAQQAQARARVIATAERQPPLPPEHNRMTTMRQQIEDVFRLLVSDATLYERARFPADEYRYYLSARRFNFDRLSA